MRVALILLTMAALLAEPGRLRVRVTDGTEAVVLTSVVKVTLPDGKVRTARPDGSGVATFTDLPASKIKVSVTAPGFHEWAGESTPDVQMEARLKVGDAPDGILEVTAKPKSIGVRFKNWLTSCTRK